MAELVLFNLKRKYANRITIIANVLLFLLCYVAVHFDGLIESETKVSICLDSTLSVYHELFEEKETETYYYQPQQEETDAVLLWNNGYVLQCNRKINDEVIKEIEQDLKDVLILSNHNEVRKIQNINLQVLNNNDDIQDGLWIILTIIYMMIVSYGSSISNEILYEKSSHVLEMILTNTTPLKHLISKIITSYLNPIIQTSLLFIYLIICLTIRCFQDGLEPMLNILQQYSTDGISNNIINCGTSILWCLPVLFSGILLIQIVILLLCSGMSRAEEIGSLQSIIYILFLAIYYILMFLTDQGFFKTDIAMLLSYIPIVSTFVMSCRFFIGEATVIQVIISSLLNIGFLFVLMKKMLPVYQENILNCRN